MSLPPLYTIADASFGDPVDLAAKLFLGGTTLLQIRAKAATSRELLHMARAVVALAPVGASVIINDRADIAREAGAHGVHIGQDDLPPAAARRIIGPSSILGFSTHNLTQVSQSSDEDLNYIAFGPVFQTTTKDNPDPAVGLDGLREALRLSAKPVVAIGGITSENVMAVWGTGAHSVAVISDILTAPDVSARVREYLRLAGKTRQID